MIIHNITRIGVSARAPIAVMHRGEERKRGRGRDFSIFQHSVFALLFLREVLGKIRERTLIFLQLHWKNLFHVISKEKERKYLWSQRLFSD